MEQTKHQRVTPYCLIRVWSVPEKMRLEIVIGMRIEILDGGEILANQS